MRAHSLASIVALSLAAPLAAGCGASSNGGGSEQASTSSLEVAITSVPTGVRCIEIDITGNPSVTKRIDIFPGQSSANLQLTQIPVGSVDITGYAYNATCFASTGTSATWFTPSQAALIKNDGSSSIAMTFYASGNATLGADFATSAYRDVTTYAGASGQKGSVDGPAISARFNAPNQIANDGTNLYVADSGNKTIRQIVLATGAVTTIAGNPTATGAGVDGVGPNATFNRPIGVAADGAGNLYVTDGADNTIRRIVLGTGAVTTIAGTPGQVGSANGTGPAAQFNLPYGIAADSAGHIYVADAQNYTVRLVTPAGVVTTFAGVAGKSGATDGAVGVGLFTGPVGIALDAADGALFVSDGSTIRQVDTTSKSVFTIAGDPQTVGSADGPAPHFGAIYGLAFDPINRNLFAGDGTYYNIRQVNIDTGVALTVAGTPGVPGAADGNGPDAQFRLPLGVTEVPNGDVYVVDRGPTVRKLAAPASH
jgi:hypothetical protein